MVVVGITLFLSGILLSYNRSTDSLVVLAAEQARVAGAFFRAKSFALQKNIRVASPVACGFGVYLEKPRTVRIFQDLPTSGACNRGYDSGELLEEITLNPKVELSAFTQGGGGASSVSVVFSAPYLETANPGTITLRLVANTSQTKTVVVNAGGGISTP